MLSSFNRENMLSRVDILVSMTSCVILKGTATLMISMCYQKELYEEF